MLPALNERDNIIQLIDDIYAAVPDVHEVIVVDDNSTDGTGDSVRSYAAKHPTRQVRLEVRTTDHGLTKSIAHGVVIATGDVVVWMDCDLSMPANVIPRLLHGLDEGYDAVVGSRFVVGGSFKRDTAGTQDSALAVTLSRLMNYGIQLILDHRFKDYTSGFIAIRRAVVQDLVLRGDYGEYFIDLMFRAMRAGYLVLEIPYACLPRLHGTSKTGTGLAQYMRRGRNYVATAIGLRLAALRGGVRPQRSVPPAEPVRDDSQAVIRPMRLTDVPLVAGLHHRLLFDTLSSRLGIPFLERLYAGLLADPPSRCWVGFTGNRCVAFVSATRDLHRTELSLTRHVPLRERLIAALHVFTNGNDLRSFLSHRSLTVYVRLRFGRPYSTILTLGVLDTMWGTGLAGRLLEVVADHFRSQGVHSFHVDTTVSNTRAVGFYRKNGFRDVGSVAGNLVFERSTADAGMRE